jgi:hypothetical protein
LQQIYWRAIVSTIKTQRFARDQVTSITGAAFGDYLGQHALVPVFKRGMSNTTVNSGSGDYDGGDRVIGFGQYGVDGDLLITCGWGDGVAIRRLNNDGSMTKLWHDNNAMFRDTTSTYNHMHSLDIHKGSSQIHVSSHNVNGYSMIDYSDITNTATSTNNVVNTRPSSQYMFSNGVSIDRSGIAYGSGVVTAGDWLYVNDYSATHYKKYPRRHWTNDTEELIDGTSSSYLYTDSNGSSGAVDRNGYRGHIFYDEVNDRVYYQMFYNSNFTVITSASTANPKVVWCDMGDAGVGDDGYEAGLFIVDPVNYPNRVRIGGSSRFCEVDYTPCFSGGDPTILKTVFVEDPNYGLQIGAQLKMGAVRQGITDEYCDKFPGYSDFTPIYADRGRATMGGWIDWDNERAVALVRHDGYIEDTTSNGRGRSYRNDYGGMMFRMSSANGTKWWVQTGYGLDGHSFKIWNDNIGPGLVGNWQCEFGTFISENSEEITFCNLEVVDHYTPGSCSLSYFASNNNGSTWESVTPGQTHMFSGTGTQLKIKYVATGHPNKAPYKLSYSKDAVSYGKLYTSMLDTNIPTKIVRRKIRGRKF